MTCSNKHIVRKKDPRKQTGVSLEFDGARAILKDGSKIELEDIQLSVRAQKPESRRRAFEGGDTESD